MRIRRAGLTLLLVALAILLLPSTVSAQSAAKGKAPWEGHIYPVEDLIDFGVYRTPPLSFQWNVVEKSDVVVGNESKCELVLDARYSEVISEFDRMYKQHEVAAKLTPETLPMVKQRELKIHGRTEAQDLVRYAFGSQKLNHTFSVEVLERGGQAVLRLRKTSFSMRYSGLMPPREPFQPYGANPIRMR